MSPTVDAIVVTFNRIEPLRESCRSVLGQTIPPRTLVVVDNNETPVAADLIAELDSSETEIEVIHPGRNLGPAGGFTAGFRHLRRQRDGDLDWLLLVDDDDPPLRADLVERLLDAVPSQSDNRVGGIGLLGATFSPRLLMPRPIDYTTGDVLPVDYIYGWASPLYRAAALEDVGCFRSELFWGRVELDLALRLARAGWRLYIAAGLLRSMPTPRKLLERPGRPRLQLVDPRPRDYYVFRNTIDMGLRYFAARDVALTIVVRMLLKPLANLPLHPIRATRTLRQNARAVIDGLRGRLGYTISLDDGTGGAGGIG